MRGLHVDYDLAINVHIYVVTVSQAGLVAMSRR